MEGGEEHSEAQESDSRFGDPCKVEECFRLCHELYIKSSPLRKQQVNLSVAFAKKTKKNPQKLSNASVSSMIGNIVLTGICEYAL